ncbi:cytochrome c oxidase subunit 3 [Novosphingobium sp. 9U]|uniref:cytochrome c oxidase subunit 3 n=1 Tax=Novosphingobium sp. 9U TaxID=2653158 RepID=UPI0012F1283A|nr:cytochrome c oxidase subunit 3 [Novosphingobium sp. 9U]VWX50170.1 Cytochrome c oxidase polypeptide III [Novosphingobium sp. 9U]
MTADTEPPRDRIPGEPGIWVMIMGDLFVFALLFGTVAYYRMQEPALFHASQPALNQGLGLFNTIALLTSSLLVVLGLEAARHDEAARALRLVRGAQLLGLMFVVVKAVEYYQKGGEGLLPDTNTFFMFYFVLTGMHLVHVIVGLVALHVMSRIVRHAPSGTSPRNLPLAECCALFWHMVDVLWVVLFAIFYLHR